MTQTIPTGFNHRQIKESPEEKESVDRKFIAAKKASELIRIPLSDVIYFIADRKYVTVNHKGGMIDIDESLNSLENDISESFLRIHRNALVNKSLIKGIAKVKDSNGCNLLLFNSEKALSISRRYLPIVRKFIKNA